jgi:hypothetical protein
MWNLVFGEALIPTLPGPGIQALCIEKTQKSVKRAAPKGRTMTLSNPWGLQELC